MRSLSRPLKIGNKMKLYIIPIENDCNATCPCCVKTFNKETEFGERLDIKYLEKIKDLDIDEIIIDGGGEPFLHKRIPEIITKCVDKAPTQVYTNGSLVFQRGGGLRKLKYLCLSRLHYDEKINRKLMGVRFKTLDIKKLFTPIKLSLVLMNGGISNARELRRYFRWANEEISARKILVRQMYDYEYPDRIKRMFVSSEKVFNDLCIDEYDTYEDRNKVFRSRDMKVEIETKNNPYESSLVMRANGNIYMGSTNKLFNS